MEKQTIVETLKDTKQNTVPFFNLTNPEERGLSAAGLEVEKAFSVGPNQIQLLLEYYYAECNWTAMVRLASQAVVQSIGLPPQQMNTAHLVYCYQAWVMALYNMADKKSLRILAIHLQKMKHQYPELCGQALLCRSLLKKAQTEAAAA